MKKTFSERTVEAVRAQFRVELGYDPAIAEKVYITHVESGVEGQMPIHPHEHINTDAEVDEETIDWTIKVVCFQPDH